MIAEGINKKRPIEHDFVVNVKTRYRELKARCEVLRLDILNKAKSKARQRKPDIMKIIKSDIDNGDLRSIIKNLVIANKLRKIPTSAYSFQIMKDTAQNWLRSARGFRYSPIVRKMMYGIAAHGGERTAKFLAANSQSPSLSSMQRFSTKENVQFKLGIQESNVQVIAQILEGVKNSLPMESRDCSGRVSYAFGQDETPVPKCITVHFDLDTKELYLLGFCGLEPANGDSHVCFGAEKFVVKTLQDIYEAFEKGRIANSISLVMMSVFHKSYVSYPLFISPTCGCFTMEDMRNQWDTFHDLSERYFKCLLGSSLLGVGSDGCLQRVPMQFRRMALKNKTGGYLGQFNDGFLDFILADSCIGLRGKLNAADNCAFGIYFQDFYHCVKKFVLSADIASRNLIFGNHVIMLSVVRSKILAEHPGNFEDWQFNHQMEAKLTKADIDFKDRMNVKLSQKYISKSIQSVLENDPSCDGTRFYLLCIFRFRMMFAAVYIPITERIKYCGYCLGFLWAWYHHIRESKVLTFKKNFITMQAFRDGIISLNAWILLLMSERNNKPNGTSDDFCPDKSGSNMCEIFFSMLSGFGNVEAGKRDCNVAEAARIASKKLTLLKFANEEDGIKLAGRKREHDPDRRHLIGDELELGFDENTAPERLQLFTDEYIRANLLLGYDEAITAVISIGGMSSVVQNGWESVCDYKYLAYENMSEAGIQLHQQGDNDEDDDDVDGYDNNGHDDDIGMDLDESRAPHTIPSHAQPHNGPHNFVDPDVRFFPTDDEEDEALNEAMDAIKELDALNNDDDNDQSDDVGQKPSQWHVPNEIGGWVDTRKVVALMNQNTGSNKLSKDRVTKIIQTFSSTGKKSGTAAYGSVAELNDVLQSIGLGSIASFCFQDGSVEGGVRFWLGRILRMVHRPKAGATKVLSTRIALKDIPEDLHLTCTWFTPVLNNGATVHTATTYQMLTQQVSDLKSEVDAKYIISVVDLEQEGNNYCLSKEDMSAISTYIKETSAVFATETVPKKKNSNGKSASKPHAQMSAEEGTHQLETTSSKRPRVHDGGGTAVESKAYTARGERKSTNRDSSA